MLFPVFEKYIKTRARKVYNKIWRSAKVLVDNAEHEKGKLDTAFDLVSSPSSGERETETNKAERHSLPKNFSPSSIR